MASKREPGKDILILTDNSNVYFALKKGRSSKFRLNQLCRAVLAAEVILQVRIHIRWVPTALQPADVFTRELLAAK